MKAFYVLSVLALLPSSATASFPTSRVHRAQVLSRRNEEVSTSGASASGTLETDVINQPSTFATDGAVSRLAFIHQYQAPPKRTQTRAQPDDNSLQSVLTIRGGASSNTVQNVMQSILDSALPAPIKQLIQMISKLIEDLTGFKILPEVKAKKSKAGKAKAKEVLVEEVSVKRKGTKSRQSKSRKLDTSGGDESSTKTKATVAIDEDESDADTTTSTKEPQSPTPASKPKPKPKTDAASKKFLANNLKSSNPNYRIQRELKEFISSPPPGLSVKISGKNVRLWIITLTMPENTIYAGDVYKLRVQFPANYPTSPPSVYFLPPTPRHEHVYTNGDICLSLLGKDWRPIMTAQSLAQAIMSILCGAQRKSLPMDNSRHAGNKPGQRQDDWVYHDDNC